MKYKPANNIQYVQFFGEFGVVNPLISDSSTYTLLSSSSTSSEISEEEQEKMGLNEGLIRFSVGLDQDISRTYEGIKKCLKEFKLI